MSVTTETLQSAERVLLANPNGSGDDDLAAAMAVLASGGRAVYDTSDDANAPEDPIRWMRENTARVCSWADAVAVLPGWQHDADVSALVAVARALDLPILDALTGTPVGTSEAAPASRPGADEHDVKPGECHVLCDRPVGGHSTKCRHNEQPSATVTPIGTARVGRETDVRETPPHVLSTPAQTPTPTSGSGEIRTVSATGGAKGTKEARFDLIPTGPLWELAVLYGRGNEKYPPEPGELANWKRGYAWSLSYAALKRHLDLFWTGEDYDPEMGVKHLINVAWHAFILAWFMENRPGFDDRPIKAEKYDGALPTPQWILDKQAAAAQKDEAA